MKKIAPLLLAAGIALTGCTAPGVASVSSPSSTSTPNPSSTVAGGPKFTGPYAAMLTDVYAESHSTFEREALADGKITDAEHAEMIERLRTCLAGSGHRLVSFDKTGRQEIEDVNPNKDPDVGHKEITSCQASSGENTVGLIYSAMLTNPQNIDLVPKVIACLKKHHLVGPSYSKNDYQHELPHFSDHKKDAQVTQCNDDPLNLTRGK